MSEPFEGRDGAGVRVGVIDSGVNAGHSHIFSVAGGVTMGDTIQEGVFPDLLGHGTAVMAAIQEKAPKASYFAVRIFTSALRTRIDLLLQSIEWCLERELHVVNLSLGTSNPDHAGRFGPLIARAAEQGLILIAASEGENGPALPGSLPGVIGVALDRECPRATYRCRRSDSGIELAGSGYPRPLPGVPKERNLQGISFAVANLTGFAVRACQALETRDCAHVLEALAAEAGCIAK